MQKFYDVPDFPKLGFGLMRLPCVPGSEEIDMEQFKKMVDRYMETGMNYFDTAYLYHDSRSEKSFKAAVAERYARDSYILTTKLPIWSPETYEDLEKIFSEQLERTGAGYFDFYLHHCLNAENDEKSKRLGAYDFIKKLKANGKIGHIGFSYHGDAKTLRMILEEQPHMEFVQLQLNYLDFLNQEGDFYRICREFNKPIVVMEPVRGGLLSMLPEAAAAVLDKANPNVSRASWAIRWCAGLPGVVTVLSGMSNMEQLEDNIKTIQNFKPLNEDELKVTDEVAKIIRSINPVPCTECRYCKDCPGGIHIPELFMAYNKWIEDKSFYQLGQKLKEIPEGKRSHNCVGCGHCESHCPQSINIIERLSEIAHITKQAGLA